MVARVAGKQRNIFVVRQGEDVHAYVNWCPHNQVLIDQIPGNFLTVIKRCCVVQNTAPCSRSTMASA